MLPGVGVFGTGKLLEAVVPHLRSLGFHVVALWGQTVDEAAKVAGMLISQAPLVFVRHKPVVRLCCVNIRQMRAVNDVSSF